MLLIDFRILRKKLMFLHHLINLPETSLAREVLILQIKNGIYNECKHFFSKFNLSDLSLYSKSQFKRIINARVKEFNKLKLIEMVRNKQYKKIDIENYASDDFEIKNYLCDLDLSDVILRFKRKS